MSTTGHSGNLSTIHANFPPAKALSRLASCVLQRALSCRTKPSASIGDFNDILVHVERRHARRRIQEIPACESYSPTEDRNLLETVFTSDEEYSSSIHLMTQNDESVSVVEQSSSQADAWPASSAAGGFRVKKVGHFVDIDIGNSGM